MLNPFAPPAHATDSERHSESIARPTTLLLFGLLPAAIFVARAIWIAGNGTQSWGWFDWIWHTAPQTYLFLAWILVLTTFRSDSKRAITLTAAVLVPLVLFSLFVFFFVVLVAFHPEMIFELDGLLMLDFFLWVCSSAIVSAYFCRLAWRRLHWVEPQRA